MGENGRGALRLPPKTDGGLDDVGGASKDRTGGPRAGSVAAMGASLVGGST